MSNTNDNNMPNEKGFEFEVIDGGKNSPDPKESEALKAIHKAGEEYLETEEGKNLLERNKDVEVEFPEMEKPESQPAQNGEIAAEAKARKLKDQIEKAM